MSTLGDTEEQLDQCVASATAPAQNFPTALMGQGNSTEITFLQNGTMLGQTPVSAIFWSQLGQLLDRRDLMLASNATSSVTFESDDPVQVGHVEIVADPGVFSTEIINLSIPGVGDVPPIGVSPSPPCESPVIALKRNAEFDTGVALSQTGEETDATCSWSIYSGMEGTLVGSGTTTVPISGQTQFFPLNDPTLPPLLLPFEGNIQYDCDMPVHPFSLFQREQDGAIFSNAARCLDLLSTAPGP